MVEVGKDFARTEMGVYYRDFEREVAKKNLSFPSYPASRSIAAMGGIVNNNAGGERTLEYGKTEKYVEEVSVVLSDGSSAVFGPLTPPELEKKKLVISIDKNSSGVKYSRRLRWRLSNEAYEAYKKHQSNHNNTYNINSIEE